MNQFIILNTITENSVDTHVIVNTSLIETITGNDNGSRVYMRGALEIVRETPLQIIEKIYHENLYCSWKQLQKENG